MTDALLLLSLAARWLTGWYLGGRCPTLEAVQPDAAPAERPHRAAVSVVIPARNEAQSLPALLQSLAAQVTPAAEVIVVDDHSSDDTAAVATRHGARVAAAADIPRGWLGKPWACAQGAAIASGEVLVFLDADTTAGPELLARLRAAVQQTRGLVSVAPYHQTERAYELGSALFNLVAFMGVGASSLRRGTRATGAFGPCIAIGADTYAAIGGHGAVRGEVLEDVALARVCERHSVPVVNVAGAADLRYRMYPDGPAQLVEGWSKNFAAGAAGTPLPRLIAIVAWLSGILEAGVLTVAGAGRVLLGGPGPSWAYLLFYILFAVQLGILLRRLGNHSAIAWIHPIATLAFVTIFIRSAALQLRGEVTWKGRTIAIRPRRSRP